MSSSSVGSSSVGSPSVGSTGKVGLFRGGRARPCRHRGRCRSRSVLGSCHQGGFSVLGRVIDASSRWDYAIKTGCQSDHQGVCHQGQSEFGILSSRRVSSRWILGGCGFLKQIKGASTSLPVQILLRPAEPRWELVVLSFGGGKSFGDGKIFEGGKSFEGEKGSKVRKASKVGKLRRWQKRRNVAAS